MLPDLCDLLCAHLPPPALCTFARTCKAAHEAARPVLATLRPRFEAERLLCHLGLKPTHWNNTFAEFISIPYISRNNRVILRERWCCVERRPTSIRRYLTHSYLVMQIKTYPTLEWPNSVCWKLCRRFDELQDFMRTYTYTGYRIDDPVGAAITPLFVRSSQQTITIPAILQRIAPV